MLFENFVQILEGEPDIVESVYNVICADSRHDNIQQIYKGHIRERSFADWSMGYEFTSPMSGKHLEFNWTECEEQLDMTGSNVSRGIQFFKYLKGNVLSANNNKETA